MKIEKCSSPSDALEKLADKIESDSQKPGDFCIAFSGGESAKKMFWAASLNTLLLVI